jgi:hypothetical protein
LLGGTKWLAGLGVDIKSNGSDQGSGTSCGGLNSVNGVHTGYEWVCVELVNRLYLTRGWTNVYWPGNGNQMYANAPKGLAKEPQNSISYVGPGDVISVNESANSAGHVFIVNSPHRITSGTVPLVSQNFGLPNPSAASLQRRAARRTGPRGLRFHNMVRGRRGVPPEAFC